MGGRGKTPVVRHLAARLVAAGHRPAVLSRGYGRRVVQDGVVVVSDGQHILADIDRAGDEPLMLARSVPGVMVLVCEQRAIAARLASGALGATVLILDDGFQHRAMSRDMDLVTIAPEDLNSRRLPFGPLREGPGALRRADAVLVDGELGGTDVRQIVAPVFTMVRTAGAPRALEPETTRSFGPRVVALSGIARPARFVDSLRAAGYQVARHISFRDHHRFSPVDLARVAAAVHETDASGVLTTEKDAARLMPFRPFPVPIAAVPLQLSFAPAGSFDVWFDARMAELVS